MFIEQYGNVSFCTQSGYDYLVRNCKNVKYKALFAVLGYAGLRISEALALKWKDFDFMKKEVKVGTLKKRRKNSVRIIPLHSEVIDKLSRWSEVSKYREKDDFVFYGKNRERHLSRKVVDRKLKTLIPKLSAHKLRHLFATRLSSEGTPDKTIQKLLGHESILTTQIYTHVPADILRAAIQSTESKTIIQRIQTKLFPDKKVSIIPFEIGETNFHVGRKKELETIADLMDKKVNFCLKGNYGIGKKHLLRNLKGEKIIRLDEFKGVKDTLKSMLLKLYDDDKNAILIMMKEKADFHKFLNATSTLIATMIELLIDCTEKKEYTILIESVGSLTPSAARTLSKLSNHFHIVTAATAVQIKYKNQFSNFQFVEIKPLSRQESIKFIEMVAAPLQPKVDDWEHFKNYIYDQTNGNPRFMLEQIERYRVESNLSVEVVGNLRHTAAKNGVNILPFFAFLLCLTAGARYIPKIMAKPEGIFYAVAVVGMIMLWFYSRIMTGTKRKYI